MRKFKIGDKVKHIKTGEIRTVTTLGMHNRTINSGAAIYGPRPSIGVNVSIIIEGRPHHYLWEDDFEFTIQKSAGFVIE